MVGAGMKEMSRQQCCREWRSRGGVVREWGNEDGERKRGDMGTMVSRFFYRLIYMNLYEFLGDIYEPCNLYEFINLTY